jgi:hypothetical protein
MYPPPAPGTWPNRKERRRLGLRGRNYLAEMRGLR